MSCGRVRSHASGSSKTRLTRRHVAAALPPVKLPRSFLDDNVSVFPYQTLPRLPIALAEDAKYDKISRLFSDQGPSSRNMHETLASYFETALDILLRQCGSAMGLIRSNSHGDDVLSISFITERMICNWDMVLDAAWHLTDALSPSRQAEYTYKIRPFWWWHIYKDLDHRTHTFRDQFPSLSASLHRQLFHVSELGYSLAHAMADLPANTLLVLTDFIEHELKKPAPSNLDPKTCRRPIAVLSMSGYGGKAIAEAVAEHVAASTSANLVRLDAYELSVLVGDYLGQDWAYSRGAASMMGFRAAELNGKLARDPDSSAQHNHDEDNDTEAGMTGDRTSSGTLEDELQKIKQGAYDCFTKWENLKIDKILDQIIRSPDLKLQAFKSHPVLIHIHDLVEMSMTLEGSLLIGRLRALVDAAWLEGVKIVILGTSSCEQPSEEYQQAVRDLGAGDLVVTRHIQPNRADRQTTSGRAVSQFCLQKADYVIENLRNINRMLRAMDPDSAQWRLDLSTDGLQPLFLEGNPQFSFLRDSILPIPEVYRLACTFRACRNLSIKGNGIVGTLEKSLMGPLRQKPGQSHLYEEGPKDEGAESGETAKSAEEPKSGQRITVRLNEYESRIIAGHINREKLRVTFSDVHAPPETISALKLLTSLALVRPDAFSYGVLAKDKIPGCLLYGPPGTGKTMLAKAVAKESGASMLEVSGAIVNDKWVGESEKLVRAIFTLAKRLSPCVVFIDEADSLLANRTMFGRISHRQLINQFLREWDGMEDTNAFIMVATNRPFDLDDAVLRRLPRKILVDLPLKGDRAAILRLLLKGETLDSSVSLEEYAERTPHYSGSDLKNMCVAAAMAAVEEENEAAAKHTGPEASRYPERRVLRKAHFERALQQIPASISEDMETLKMIRKFDEEYGDRRSKRKRTVGFGILEDKQDAGAAETRIRPGSNP